MDLGIQDKVALITGASKGIGRASALELAKEGCHCIITGRRADPLKKTAEEIQSYGVRVLSVMADITHPQDRQRIVSEAIKAFGSVDILVNNAGGIDKVLAFEEISLDQWRLMFEWNVFSVAEMIKLVVPFMQLKKWGRIINIGSESGIQPDALFPHYNAAKAAVLNMTKSLSRVYAKDGILINAVSPAFIRTEQVQERAHEISSKLGKPVDQVLAEFLKENRSTIELKRLGKPEEVAAVVALLASERSSFILGTNIRIDGGSVGII